MKPSPRRNRVPSSLVHTGVRLQGTPVGQEGSTHKWMVRAGTNNNETRSSKGSRPGSLSLTLGHRDWFLTGDPSRIKSPSGEYWCPRGSECHSYPVVVSKRDAPSLTGVLTRGEKVEVRLPFFSYYTGDRRTLVTNPLPTVVMRIKSFTHPGPLPRALSGSGNGSNRSSPASSGIVLSRPSPSSLFPPLPNYLSRESSFHPSPNHPRPFHGRTKYGTETVPSRRTRRTPLSFINVSVTLPTRRLKWFGPWRIQIQE